MPPPKGNEAKRSATDTFGGGKDRSKKRKQSAPSATKQTDGQSSHISDQNSSNNLPSTTSSQNPTAVDGRLLKPPKPRCVRISRLSRHVDEPTLRTWLSGLPTTSISDTGISQPNLLQFSIARNDKYSQATAIFTTIPDVFSLNEKYITLDSDDIPKDYHGAIVDSHFEGMTVVYEPPEGDAIKAELVEPQIEDIENMN